MTHVEPATHFDLSAFRPAIMPGESPSEFENLYYSVISELSTPSSLLQVLCAQLAEAMIWYRRHQRDKQRTIVECMVDEVVNYQDRDQWRTAFMQTVDGAASDETREAVLDQVYLKGHTLESLSSRATVAASRRLEGIEKLIDRQFKVMRQLQKTIAEVEAKPLVMRRLALQVEHMARDINALPHEGGSVVDGA